MVKLLRAPFHSGSDCAPSNAVHLAKPANPMKQGGCLPLLCCTMSSVAHARLPQCNFVPQACGEILASAELKIQYKSQAQSLHWVRTKHEAPAEVCWQSWDAKADYVVKDFHSLTTFDTFTDQSWWKSPGVKQGSHGYLQGQVQLCK